MTKSYMDFDNELRAMYQELGIKHLNELDINETTPAGFFADIVRKKQPVQGIWFPDFKMAHEMDFITQDMKYITGMLFFLRPYINNPLYDGGRYMQTVGDRRYLMHITFGLQAVYNYWDRLGDLLWHFFPTNLTERDVYFDRIIEMIKPPYNSCEAFNSLNKLYRTYVKPIMQMRKETVHYFQPECRHYWGNVEDNSHEGIKERYEEKFGYADLMLSQLSIALKAFELTLNLINELPDK
jgi:hypothetical protein